MQGDSHAESGSCQLSARPLYTCPGEWQGERQHPAGWRPRPDVTWGRAS